MNKYILVINLRRLNKEAYISLCAIKRQGYKIYLLAKELPDYGKNLIDQFTRTDTTQFELTIEMAKSLSAKFNIAGIACLTETAVEISSYIAAELNLPGNSIDAVIYSRNKLAMREKLKSAQVEHVPFAHIKNIADAKNKLDEISFPAIAKPINSSGSTGIFFLNNQQDANTFIENAFKITNPQFDPVSKTSNIEFILEKYIDGPEVSVEGFVFNNDVMICGITDKLTTDYYKIEYQHIFPSAISDAKKSIIQTTVKKIICALGFNNCSFHLEGKLFDNKFYLIEIAVRPAGGYIASHLIPNATGANFYDDLIRICAGKQPNGDYTPNAYSGIRFGLAHQEGIFSRIDNVDLATQHPLLNSFFIETAFGTRVLLPPNDYRLLRLYSFIVTGSTHNEVTHALETLDRNTKPVIKEIIQ